MKSTTVVAASTLLALAGSSYGFVINYVSVGPGESIAPSTGSFVDYYDCYICSFGSMPPNSRSTWKDPSLIDLINSMTWLALDSRGGAAGYGYQSIGPGADPFMPFAPGSSAQWLGAANAGLQAETNFTASAIIGGVAGVKWGPGHADNFEMNSAVSPINGESIDSVFVGHLVLTDPSASIVGSSSDAVFAMIDGVDIYLPVDGSEGDSGYSIRYEEGIAPWGYKYLDMFIVVPTPGVAGLLGIAGLSAVKRRRR